MIDLLIYHLHLVAFLYAFTMRWQREGLAGGFLALALCGLAFTIVWALMGPLARLLMPGAVVPGDLFTSDTLSLVLTMIIEVPFFFVIFFRRGIAGSK